MLDNAAYVAWGSRILEKPLKPEVRRDSFCLVMKKIERKPYNAYFTTMIGPESYKLYMVVTQSKLFLGWKGMDPKLIPLFDEGEHEDAARELLKAEGRLPSVYILLFALTPASQVSRNLNSEQNCISPSKFWKAVLNDKEREWRGC